MLLFDASYFSNLADSLDCQSIRYYTEDTSRFTNFLFGRCRMAPEAQRRRNYLTEWVLIRNGDAASRYTGAIDVAVNTLPNFLRRAAISDASKH
jgi:hypothetical protein